MPWNQAELLLHPILAILTSFWTNIAYLQLLTSHFTVFTHISLKYLAATSPPVRPIIISKFLKSMIYKIIFTIFWDFLMFYQIFPSLQAKRCSIITYEHDTYELPNDLKLRTLGNEEISEKCLNFIEWCPSSQSSYQNKIFVNTSKKLLKNRNFSRSATFYVKTRVSLNYFVIDCLWKPSFDSNSPQNLSNVIALSIVITLRPALT